MGNIQVDAIKADIKDRLDNMVERGQISSPERNKLTISNRLGYAIDQAYNEFVAKSSPDILSQLAEHSNATIDSSVNESSPGAGDGDGVIGSIKVYQWPSSAYAARPNGGILNYVINSTEYNLTHSIPFVSLRDASESLYYGSAADLFSVDMQNKRLYAPKDSSIKLRYIKVPQTIVGDNISELKIDTAYRGDIINLTLSSLLNLGFSSSDQQEDTDNDGQ